MLLNEWLGLEGNEIPEGLEPLSGGRWRDPVDGWVGMAFQFDYIGDRDDLEGTWRGENRRTKEQRAVVAVARAFAPAPPVPYDIARRRAYLEAWPLHRQLEAYAEDRAGRPELLVEMLADVDRIKGEYPKP